MSDHPNAPKWWYEQGEPDSVRLGLLLKLVHREKTPYQDLGIYEHDILGRVLVLDDILQTTEADEYIYHEMLSHVPLLGAPFARSPSIAADVLIIGGGDGGLLREVLRHDWITRVVMVEIDPAVIEHCARYLSIHGNYEDARVQLLNADAAAYLSQPGVTEQPFDAILVDSTDPVGKGKVLFEEKFYRDALTALKPQGVLARHLGVPFLQFEVFLQGAKRMKSIFGNVQIYRAAVPSYIGGDMAFAISTRDGSTCRVPQRSLTARYYNPDLHASAFALPTAWMEALQS